MDEFYIPPYSAPPPSMIPPAPTRTPPPSSNAPLNPSTAIFNAILQNNVGLVRSILNQTQFNPNILRNKDGKTPLMVAACENCPDVVKYLVELQNVNIDLQDNDGESALYQAASVGNAGVVDILINANANVESRNKENITPLIVAAYNGHDDVCRVLIDHGYAKVNFQDNSYKTALSLASYEGRINVVKVLLARGANVHITDQYGWTALMLAAYAGRGEVCQLLLEYHSDKSITTNNGKTAVILAYDAGYSDVAKLIEKYGNDNDGNDGNNNFNSNNINSNFNASNNFNINNNFNVINNFSINNNFNDYNNIDNVNNNNNNNNFDNYNDNNHYNKPPPPPHRSSLQGTPGGIPMAMAQQPIKSNYNMIDTYNNNNNDDNNDNNNDNNDKNNKNIDNYNYNNHHNKLLPPPHHSNRTSLQGTPSGFPTAQEYYNKIDNYNNNNDNDNNKKNLNINKNNNNIDNHHNNKLLSPPHRSSRTFLQGTPGGFPIAMVQHPTGSNLTPQDFYPEISINEHSTKGYLMPLNRRDSRRKKLQHKNSEHFSSQYFNNNNTGSNTTNGGKFHAKTAPHLKNDMAPRENKTPWVLFSLAVTACFCNPCLSTIGKMKDPIVRQAWREKLALVIIIALISLFMGFLAFGLATVACGTKKETFYKEDVFDKFGPNQPNRKMHIIRGRLYDTGGYILFGNHRPLTPPMTDQDLEPIIYPTFGQDISEFFPLDNNALKCPFTPKNIICNTNKLLHCHTSPEVLSKLKDLDQNQRVVYSWENITKSNTTLFVYSNSVYDLGNYLDPSNDDKWLGDDSVTEWLKTLLGKDSTIDIVRTTRGKTIARCLPNFIVGEIEGTTIGCFAHNLIIIMMTVVFTGISIIKFISAIAFDWFLSWQLGKLSKKPITDDMMSHILLLVTCYSEGEISMRTTLDSLAGTNYSDKHKLLIVIADGDITGSENDRSTPQICKDLIEPFDLSSFESPTPQSYLAIGDGKKQHNMAEVIIGYYNCKDHRVPMCIINKVGTPEERKGVKAGNRGKRDSQLILMKWLSNICFNERMTPLEFELFEKVRTLTGVTPDKYEMVLMVDADTLVMKDSVSRMVAAMERDPTVMGLCGETKIANKTSSWVTMIQVFEYYISHHLGKSFESIFGGVTCLPGCFCMYRIKAPKYNGYSVPVLANPDIVEVYSSNTVETLHQKNLLLLGEDRYLTTLMLRTFPKRKMIYVPKAICKTIVPDEFRVLLSQRRRWINSTIHNLMELILVPQLCGIFCCSMQFVIFLELIGTVVLPCSLIFIGYIIIVGVLGANVTLPLLFIAATFFLQAFLVIFTTHKIIYIMWMIIFILAMPIWNFILPLYAFWHFDDFSWGATRKIAGEDNGHGGNKDDEFERNQIPRKKWLEWKLDDYEMNHPLPPSPPSPQPDQNTNTQHNNPLQNLPPSQQIFTGDLPPITNNFNYNTNELNNTNNNFNNDLYNGNNSSSQSVINARPMGPRNLKNAGPKNFDVIRY